MTVDQFRTTRRQQAIPSIPTTSKPDPSQTVINQILGNRTLLEFDQLPVAERNITLRSYLSQKTGPIVVDAIAAWNELNRDVEAANNPQNPPSSPAEDDSDLYFARNRLQLAAYEICFSENTFLVSIHRLPGFIRRFGPQGSKSVTQLVKHITIAIPNSYGLSPSEVRSMAKDLRLLLDFTSPEQVGVRIIGPGPADGTDWYTQETIRVISPTIRDLINLTPESIRSDSI